MKKLRFKSFDLTYKDIFYMVFIIDDLILINDVDTFSEKEIDSGVADLKRNKETHGWQQRRLDERLERLREVLKIVRNFPYLL